MASIRKRVTSKGEVRYQALVRLKGFPPQTATFNRRTDAKRWVQSAESAIREGRHFKTSLSKKKTLNELIQRYISDVLPKKPKSYKKQRAQLEWWAKELGDYALAEITPSKLSESRDYLLKDRAPATVVRYFAALSHAFTVAVNEWEWIESNPVKRVSKPKEPRGRVRFLSDDERISLLEACRESSCKHLYPVVVLALSTGMRQSEILNLTWSQVDFKRGVLTLEETKNGEIRGVPLVGYAKTLLQQASKVRKIDTQLIFGSDVTADTPVFIRKPWNDAVKKSGIKDFRFHDLRHTAASYLAMNGASLTEIAEILGHKTLNMVHRYAHLSGEHTSKVLESMNKGIFYEQS